MTFDNDFIRLVMDGGNKDLTCKALGVDWPPPEKITVWAFQFELTSLSGMTDAERAISPRICRGALYKPVV